MSRRRPVTIGEVLGAFVLALVASLLLARVHPFGDAGLYATQGSRAGDTGSILDPSSAPPQVRAILTEKCADCHTTQTRAPIYGRFAPVSWLMERDIIKGRKAMNLSLWESYSTDQQQTFASKIVQEVRAGEMPLLQYRMIHWGARVNTDEVRQLQQWARQNPVALPGSASAGAFGGEGNAANGKQVFDKRCSGCHALDSDREGPRLHDVYGRRAGAVAGFSYSAALKKSNIVWNDATLEAWLTDPDTMVPGNDMEFHVAKVEERRDLIRFLKEAAVK